ncbi:hypothetical protein, partial [Bradyrhizobium sp. MOS001]|uniref:hypothetical protein n=1 Tax=Bradyrhizobium sp. MOS001 TaxID=2133948 RepID=UPI00195FBB95
KKARSNTPLSCKIEYYIKTNSAYFSDQSAFFTDDYLGLGSRPIFFGDKARSIARSASSIAAPFVVVCPPMRTSPMVADHFQTCLPNP